MTIKNDIPFLKIAENLELKRTDHLLMAADLYRLSNFFRKQKERFDVSAFIDSFITYLDKGSLIIPTFTDNLKNGDTFDVSSSKPNIGALAVAAFKKNNGCRTIEPFHSFKAFGALEADFKSINNKSTFGPDSAFALLKKNKAKMLLIDVKYNNSFTFVHYCEEASKAPWRKYVKHNMNIINYDGVCRQQEHFFFTRKRGYLNHLDPLEIIFEKEKISTKFLMNSITFEIIDLEKAYSRIVEDIKNNKGKSLHKFSLHEFAKLTVKSIIKT